MRFRILPLKSDNSVAGLFAKMCGGSFSEIDLMKLKLYNLLKHGNVVITLWQVLQMQNEVV